MENVKIAVFKVESEAYQAMTEIKNNLVNENYILSQMALIKKENGKIILKDAFDTGVETTDDTKMGGVIGGLLGIIGGPLGMIFSGSIGSLIGTAIDEKDNADNFSIIEKVCTIIPEGETAIIALVQEIKPVMFDKDIAEYDSAVITFDAAEVAEEVERDREIQRQIEKDARQKAREKKKEEYKEKLEKKKEEIKNQFENIINKFNKR